MSIYAKVLKQLQGSVTTQEMPVVIIIIIPGKERVLCRCRGSGIRLVYPSSGIFGGTFMDQLVAGQDEV